MYCTLYVELVNMRFSELKWFAVFSKPLMSDKGLQTNCEKLVTNVSLEISWKIRSQNSQERYTYPGTSRNLVHLPLHVDHKRLESSLTSNEICLITKQNAWCTNNCSPDSLDLFSCSTNLSLEYNFHMSFMNSFLCKLCSIFSIVRMSRKNCYATLDKYAASAWLSCREYISNFHIAAWERRKEMCYFRCCWVQVFQESNCKFQRAKDSRHYSPPAFPVRDRRTHPCRLCEIDF